MIFETVDWYSFDSVSWQSIPVIYSPLAEVIMSDVSAACLFS